MCIYFWERQSVSRGGLEREEDRIQSRLQALSYQHRAQCGAPTHELWDHDLTWSRTLNWPNHPGTPQNNVFFNVCLFLRERETQNLKQALTTEPDIGLKFTNGEIMTWAKVIHLTEPPRCPKNCGTEDNIVKKSRNNDSFYLNWMLGHKTS